MKWNKDLQIKKRIVNITKKKKEKVFLGLALYKSGKRSVLFYKVLWDNNNNIVKVAYIKFFLT